MSDPQLPRLLAACAHPLDEGRASAEALRLAAALGDWDEARTAAEREGLLPLLHWRLRDDRGAVPGAAREALRLAFFRSVARTAQVYRELERFLESLRRAGLRAALTKGGRLALDAYPEAALRPFWDVDFIVHPDDWPGVRGVLAGLGFVEASGVPGPALDWSYSPYFRKGPLYLEFHGSPFGLHLPGRREDGFWSAAGRLQVRGTEALVLAAESELCYLCVHAQQHSYQRLIWLSDIARLAVRPGLDWGAVRRLARAERIKGPVYHGLSLVRTLWPEAIDDRPWRELRPGPVETAGMRFLWPAEAVAARSGVRTWPYDAPSFLSLWERRDPALAARTLATILFPSREWLAAATGVPARSARIYVRYAERLLRPAVTMARRFMEPR